MKATRKVEVGGIAAMLVIALAACSDRDDTDASHIHLHPSPGSDDPLASPGSTTAPVVGTWTELAELPERRTEIGAVAHEGRVYVAGGVTDHMRLTTSFFIYDPDTDTWEQGADMPEGRHHAPMAAHDGKIYVIGGFMDPTATLVEADTLFIYDVAGDSWTEGPPMPAPRGAHAAAVTDDGVIHVFGGTRHAGLHDDHFAFDTTTGAWSTLPPLPTAREHAGAAYLDGFVYVAAGRIFGNTTALRTFEAYDVAAQEWTTLSDMPTGRSGVAVATFDGQVYVFGGETYRHGGTTEPNRTYSEAERFDPDTGEWEQVSPMPTARHGLGAGALDHGIVVVSGGPSVGFTYSNVTEFWQP